MLEIGQGGETAATNLISDGSEATFMTDVVEASRTVPVIVDFWAPWCGPCKQLTPALEAAVKAAGGKVRLVKLNVDENQRIAQQLRIQSIPTVFAFIDGQPVDGFMGAVSGTELKAFIDKLIAAGGGETVEDVIAHAEEMLAQGAIADAAEVFSALLAEDQTLLPAIGGLSRAHLAMGQIDQAKTVLELAPPAKASDPAIATARAQIELAEIAASATGETEALRVRLAADPDDHQARLDLAQSLIAEGDPEGAMNELLELFRRDREWDEGAAKTHLTRLFDSLGPTSPLVAKGRRRLASMIFA